MPRLKTVEPNEAQGQIREIYEAIEHKMGTVPNIFKGMAASPVCLRAYLMLDDLVAEGELTGAEQEAVRLVVSQVNGCDYCLAAHTRVGKAHGLTDDQIAAIRQGRPDDDKLAALVTFTLNILETKGNVDDGQLQAFRDAGYTDAHVGDVLTLVAQKTLSNYFNHVHQTKLDFEPAPPV